MSDDFVITTAGWLPEPASRQRWLEEVEQHHLNAFEIDTVDVRNLGDVAVVLVLSTQWGAWTGGTFHSQFRYTDVWRRLDGERWALHTRHASLLPETRADEHR